MILVKFVFFARRRLHKETDDLCWHTTELRAGTGIVLYKTNVVDAVTVRPRDDAISMDATHVHTVLDVTLRESTQNPGAHFRLGVPARYGFSPGDVRSGGLPTWSKAFRATVCEDVQLLKVRILTGFFDCDDHDLWTVGRTCGLTVGDKPFHTVFRTQWDGDTGSYTVHPNMALVIGTHDPQHPVYGQLDGHEAAPLPQWLAPIVPMAQIERGSSWLQRFARSCLPSWETVGEDIQQLRSAVAAQYDELAEGRRPPDPVEEYRNKMAADTRRRFFQRSYYKHTYEDDPLLNLGKVVSKRLRVETFHAHWAYGIHQNMVFVGHGRTGGQARAREKMKAQDRTERPPWMRKNRHTFGAGPSRDAGGKNRSGGSSSKA